MVGSFWGGAATLCVNLRRSVITRDSLYPSGRWTVATLIAVKLLLQNEDEVHIREASTTWKAIQTILIADFVMSLDNVLAIAALADGDLALIVIGIAISIPIVVWGSGLIVGLLKRFPILVFAGSGILAFTAGEMVMKDPKLGEWLGGMASEVHTLLPAAMACLVIAVGGAHKFVRKNA